mgnify:CR=1 FL=1
MFVLCRTKSCSGWKLISKSLCAYKKIVAGQLLPYKVAYRAGAELLQKILEASRPDR